MAYNVDVYIEKSDLPHANISQLPQKRDWIDFPGPHSCFPLAVSNRFGWGVSFDEDISFIWNGNKTLHTPDQNDNISDVKILSGEKYCYLNRGIGTISFETNLIFRTEENVSLLTMPVPNHFFDGAQCMTSILSTSFFSSDLNIVWKILQKDKVLTIKAGTPVAAIIPISASELQNSSMIFHLNKSMPGEKIHQSLEYYQGILEASKGGVPSDFFKNATDHHGNSIGKHEVLNFKLNTIYKEEKDDRN